MAYEHQHRWQLAQVKKEFVPDKESSDARDYIGIDYAYILCTSCGKVKKNQVKDEDEAAAI